MAQRKALGRGLGALLGTSELDVEQLREIDIDRILPNSQQPRKSFDEESLEELANSIRQHGVVQPIVVRALEDGFFQRIQVLALEVFNQRNFECVVFAGLADDGRKTG